MEGMSRQGKINSYRDLIVWQKAHELAKEIINTDFQPSNREEVKIVKNQLIRSSLSIPANIAEGYGGHKGASYKNYLIIARRSSTETDYWIFLLYDLGYITEEIYNKIKRTIDEINAMLTAMINKLDN